MFHDRNLTDLADIVVAMLSRVHAGTELTGATVLRSNERLAISRELLSVEVPKVWHPEQKHE